MVGVILYVTALQNIVSFFVFIAWHILFSIETMFVGVKLGLLSQIKAQQSEVCDSLSCRLYIYTHPELKQIALA